jgi:RHS repeat-associated protein
MGTKRRAGRGTGSTKSFLSNLLLSEKRSRSEGLLYPIRKQRVIGKALLMFQLALVPFAHAFNDDCLSEWMSACQNYAATSTKNGVCSVYNDYSQYNPYEIAGRSITLCLDTSTERDCFTDVYHEPEAAKFDEHMCRVPSWFPKLPGSPFSPFSNPPTQCGSVLHLDNRTVGEVIPITGTPFDLIYQSNQVRGRKTDYTLIIPVLGDAPYTGSQLLMMDVKISYLGRTDFRSVAAEPGATVTFTWDGLDAYGIPYPGVAEFEVTISARYAGGSADPFPIVKTYTLGSAQFPGANIGGWILSAQHQYDSASQRVFNSDGTSRPARLQKYNNGSNYFAVSADGSEAYLFDLTGKQVKTLNALTGATLYTFNYNASGNLTSIVDSFGNTTQVVRDAAGKVTGIKSPYGQLTSVTLSSNGYLASLKNPKGETFAMTYYGTQGLLKTFKTPKGQISTFTYNSDGFLESDVNSAGYSTSVVSDFLSYTKPSYTVQSTSALGLTTLYNMVFRSDGSVTWSSLPPSELTESVQSTEHQYFEQRRNHGLFSETYSLDARFGYIHDYPTVRKISFTPNDVIQTQSRFQRLTGFTPSEDPLNPNYFNFSTLSTQLNMNTALWDITYTRSNGESVVTSPEGRRAIVTTNDVGQLTASQVASYAPVSLTYDARGRVLRITQGTRNTTFAYNAKGFVSQIKNALNQAVSFTYDAAGRVLTQTLPDTRVIAYSYDASGNLLSVTPPTGSVHLLSWNPMESLQSYTSPDLGDGSARVTQYAYDKDRRLTQITKPDGTQVNFTYDATKGTLKTVSTPQGQYAFTTNAGWVTEARSPDNLFNSLGYNGSRVDTDQLNNPSAASSIVGTVKSLFNNDLNFSSHTIREGNAGAEYSIPYAYDQDTLLTGAGSETLVRSSGAGFVSSVTLDSVTNTLSYDATYGELTKDIAKVTSPVAKQVYALTLTRDPLGRVKTKAETISAKHTDQYSYDTSGRLTAVTRDGAAYSNYVYDANGNRKSGKVAGVAFSATYDAQDRLLTYNTKSYTYTPNGERKTVKDSATGVTTKYAYDSFGALKQVVVGSKTIDYGLDGLGRRAIRKVNGAIDTQYLYYDQYRIAATLDSSNRIKAVFVYGSKFNSPDYMIKGGVRYRLLSDHLGSVKVVVNSSTGAIAQKIEYDEFGRVISDSAPGFQPFGFAGCLYDIETKLCHFGAREYDPSTGRFLSKDPLLFWGGDTNLYGYVLSDPINLIDPSGLYPDDPAYIPGPGGTQGVDPGAYRQGLAIGAIGGAALDAGAFALSLAPIEFLGLGGGGRLIGVRFGNRPPLRLDFGPIDWTQESTLHYHVPWAPKVHNPVDPFYLPYSSSNSCTK